MYYQLELRPFAKSRTPEAVPIFLIRKSPETQTMSVLNSGAKIRQTTETKLVRTRYGRTGFWLFFNVC